MQEREERARTRRRIENVIIGVLCALTLLLDFIDFSFWSDEFYNHMLTKIVQQTCGGVAAILFMKRLHIKLFGRAEHWLYLLPCLLVSFNNFQFSAYFQGEMHFVRTAPVDVVLFLLYCLSVGLFEELVFRGILFSVLIDLFSKDKKGFLYAFVLSSVTFGVSHLFNGFSLGTLLQVGYTILTGGLFAFCLIKTKNILCCALVHGIYNFSGLLLDTQGLGSGVVFDAGTVVCMAVIGVLVGVFVLYKTWTYTDVEREELYKRMIENE